MNPTPSRDLATFALSLISRATAPADDVTQTNIAVTKQWLRAIASGELMVREVKSRKAASVQPSV